MQVSRRCVFLSLRGLVRPDEIVVVKLKTVVVLAFDGPDDVAGVDTDVAVPFGLGGATEWAGRSALPS